MGRWIVTSAWPYASSMPHLGNMIGSILSADVFARYLRLKKEDVVFVSGSDEHGTPIEVEALAAGKPAKEFADENHRRISKCFKDWDISFDNYTRTESEDHIEFVREFYRKLEENGYVYCEEEEVHFCSRCDRFLPDRFVRGVCSFCGYEFARGDQCESCGRILSAPQLLRARCSLCGSAAEPKKTKQWFFDLPVFSERLEEYIEGSSYLSDLVKSLSKALLKEGLRPRSLTRDTGWGIPAPFKGAEKKTIYVWMEAVLGYISAVIEHFKKKGEPERWKEYWFDETAGTSFFIGKDNIPFHSLIFTALLIGSGERYVLPKLISSTGFLLYEGKKFSKSGRIGIWIDEALKIMPVDYWRYALISMRPEQGDVSFTVDLFVEKVNKELNDNLGNLVNRVIIGFHKVSEGRLEERPALGDFELGFLKEVAERHERIGRLYESAELRRALLTAMENADEGNRYLNLTQPWVLAKTRPGEAVKHYYVALRLLKTLAVELFPVIPGTSRELYGLFEQGDVKEVGWSGALEDLAFPLSVRRLKTPLFRKVSKEEILRKLEEVRAG